MTLWYAEYNLNYWYHYCGFLIAFAYKTSNIISFYVVKTAKTWEKLCGQLVALTYYWMENKM